ncbi:MAG: metallophosphoesterase [Proteobacteria bacterium]|nr:metallophosphoesterase [Pseudomonadota bacterium]
MNRTALFALAAIFAAASPAAADTAFSVKSAWVQLAPNGGAEIRAVATGHCPSVRFGKKGKSTAMNVRADATQDFPIVCAKSVPAGASTAVVTLTDGMPAKTQRLALPVAIPKRVLVLGDTGCRIKGTYIQACNDPKAWPFAGLAKAAAAMKPDLVIHLGDYLYRESPCPEGNAGCAGSPHGDNWASWDADFFSPAAPLLAAAPWVIVRGNHEDCYRAGPGFLRMLGPSAFDPAAGCTAHIDPYLVHIGSQAIAVTDTASAADVPIDTAAVPTYAKDFETLQTLAAGSSGHEIWLATHRPILGVLMYGGAPVGGNATMLAASGDLSAFKDIDLMLAGHIHTFEAINYDVKMPPQIVAGHGGDDLDVAPPDLSAATFQGNTGVHVKDGVSVGGFGFLMLTRSKTGWNVALYDSDGKPIRNCSYAKRALSCPAVR